jgi:hypothetical protein
MTGNIIREYLVGLGFEVDSASFSRFSAALKSAAARVTAMYASVKLAAAGVAFFISKTSEGFEQLGYEMRLIAPSIYKVLVLRREMLKAYSAAGINLVRVVQNSIRLNLSLTKTRYAFEAIYKGVASRFFPLLTKQSDIFRAKIYANMPKIQDSLEKLIGWIFKAFDATTILGSRLWSILTRVYDFFAKLDTATDGWSTKILAVVAAWKLLNLSFLATPLGLVLSGLLAILALYDDFMTFKEGGKSLFNWSYAIPILEKISSVLSFIKGIIDSLIQSIFAINAAFVSVFKLDLRGYMAALKDVGASLGEIFKTIWDSIKGASSFFESFARFMSVLTPQSVASPASLPVNPISSSVQNSSTNQNIDQQTSIVVQASGGQPDAIAQAIGAQQNRVNFDMARNFKRAAQ